MAAAQIPPEALAELFRAIMETNRALGCIANEFKGKPLGVEIINRMSDSTKHLDNAVSLLLEESRRDPQAKP